MLHLGDHEGIFLHFAFCIGSSSGSKPLKYDPYKFGESGADASFAAYMKLGSFYGPWADNTSRMHYFNLYVYHALVLSYPCDLRKRMNSILSDTTGGLIAQRTLARQSVKLHNKFASPSFVVMHLVSQFKSLACNVRSSVRADYRANISSCVLELNKCAGCGNWRRFCVVKNRLCPRKKYGSLAAVSYNNNEFSSKAEIRHAFCSRCFSGLLDGKCVDPAVACLKSQAVVNASNGNCRVPEMH